LTNQRLAILDFLKGNHSHPTVEAVYEAVREKLPQISKGTVYNNLAFLTQEGLIREVHVKGVARFEMNLEPHHHVICQDCGCILDFRSEDLTQISLELGKAMKGFKVDFTSTNFFGSCDKCGGREE
jgi:Fur family transcriptional regulator, ferric uptake regulator